MGGNQRKDVIPPRVVVDVMIDGYPLRQVGQASSQPRPFIVKFLVGRRQVACVHDRSLRI
jgi:hypothetical protein